MVEDITDEGVNIIDATSGTVVVKVGAPWCGPCKLYNGVLERFSEASDIDVYSLNIDENPSTPQKYGITSIPTTLIFHDGELKDQFNGARSLVLLKRAVEEAVA